MNHYTTSSGERCSQSQLDYRITKAKEVKEMQMLDEHGFLFCERCERSDKPTEKSHICSVKYAKEIGRAEIAYDIDDIEELCRDCHEEIEVWPNKKRLKEYEKRKNDTN